MSILSEFEGEQIFDRSQTFSVTSGSSNLPQSGSFLAAPCVLFNDALSTTNLRLRLYATPKILDDSDADVQSEKSRPFGSVTGSVSGTPVFNDLILDIDANETGRLRLNPPIFGGHAFTGSDEIYYYLTEASSEKTATEATASATTSLSGNITLNYLQLAQITSSVLLSQSLTIPAGNSGVSGSFTTPEIYTLFSCSLDYISGGGGSGWVSGSRLRIYQDQASMDAPGEIDRPFDASPSASFQYISGDNISPFSGSGIIIDILFSGSFSGGLFPVNIGANMYNNPTTESFYRFEPTSSVPSNADIDFTLQIVQLK